MPEKKGGISNNGKGYKGMPFSININTPPELCALCPVPCAPCPMPTTPILMSSARRMITIYRIARHGLDKSGIIIF